MRWKTVFYAMGYVAGFVALSSVAQAHGPTPQKIDETIDIKADPKTVWAIAGDFAGISKWDSELKASEGSNEKRVITFKNGEQLEEEVDEYKPDGMTYSYRMLNPNLKAAPVSSYSATLAVTPGADGGSHVEWYGRFYRGDTGNEPPDDLNDEAGREAMTKLFKAGLNGLKAKAEGHS
jgi:mxaD protein